MALAAGVLALVGAAAGAAPKAISGPTTVDFGTSTVGGSAYRTYWLTNTTAKKAVMVVGLPSNDAYRVIDEDGNGCAIYDVEGSLSIFTVLDPNARCQMKLRVTVPSSGKLPAASITAEVYPETQGRPNGAPAAKPAGPALGTLVTNLTATGTLPTFEVSRAPMAFGSTTVGGSKQASLTLRNTSTVPLVFDSQAGGAFAVPPGFANTSCTSPDLAWFGMRGVAIAPGASCSVEAEYAPTAVGASKGTLSILASALPDAQPGTSYLLPPTGATSAASTTVALTGTGVAPTFDVLPEAIALGSVTVGDYPRRPVTVLNTSDVPLQVVPRETAGIFLTLWSQPDGDACIADRGHQGVSFAAFAILQPGKQCTFVATFGPSAAIGKSQSIPLTVDAFVNRSSGESHETDVPDRAPAAKRTITATVKQVAPTAVADDATLDFDSVTVGGEVTLATSITNTSTLPIGVAVPDGAAAPFSIFPEEMFSPGDRPTTCDWISSPWHEHLLQVLQPGQSCAVRVTYRPTKVSGLSGDKATLSLGLHTFPLVTDPEQTAPTSAPLGTLKLNVKGVGKAVTSAVEPTAPAFGSVTVGTSNVRPIAITNTSDVRLVYALPASGPFSEGTPGPTAQEDGDCRMRESFAGLISRVLEPGASCLLPVQFAPTEAKKVSATLSIQAFPASVSGPYEIGVPSGTPSATVKVTASGTGTVPAVRVEPALLDFGTVWIGGDRTEEAYLWNDSETAVVLVPATPSSTKYVVTDSPTACTSTVNGERRSYVIQPHGYCTVPLRYTPTSSATATGTVAVGVHVVDTGEPYVATPTAKALGSVAVKVTGTAKAVPLTISPSPLDFGARTIGAQAENVITITNPASSTAAAVVEPGSFGVGTTPFGPGRVVSGTCTQAHQALGTMFLVVAPGQSCTLAVRFTPTATAQATGSLVLNTWTARSDHAGAYVLHPTDKAAPTKALALKGTGQGIRFELTPETINFDPTLVGQSQTKTTTFTNRSTTALLADVSGLGLPFIDGPQSGLGTCRQVGLSERLYVIAPGASCTFEITYYAQEGQQEAQGRLKVWIADPDVPPGSIVEHPTRPEDSSTALRLYGQGFSGGGG